MISARWRVILYMVSLQNTFKHIGRWGFILVFIRRIIYKILDVCSVYTAVVVSRKVGIPFNRFNHTNLVAVVTPTDCPKSVPNRCVIEYFGAVLCCHAAFLDFSVVQGHLS